KERWDWSQKYPVVKLPFASMGYRTLGLEEAIIRELKAIAKEYQLDLNSQRVDVLFRELLEKLYAECGQVVLLVDEYDKPIIDYIGTDLTQAKENQQIMKTFYSVVKDADEYLRFVFITGVSRFSKVSIFSDLNNLLDISMHPACGSLLGYTNQELENYFSEKINQLAVSEGLSPNECREEMRKWYDGYDWLGPHKMYNPFGILQLFSAKRFANYWFATGTPTFLIDLLKSHELYDLDGVETGESVFESFQVEKDFNLISLMYQTGYLTIKAFDKMTRTYTLGYPNLEVKSAFLEHLLGAYAGRYSSESIPEVVKVKKAFEANDIERVMYLTNVMLKNVPYQIHEQTERFYHAIVHLMYFFLGVYIESEVCTSDGRADAVVQTETHVYCLEFKFNRSAEEALEQIRKKNYLQKYGHLDKQLVGVGVNFSTEARGINEWELMKF
ncbi:MAG: ATP-binding protein, partial [Cytophagales bacterium]|nr:ATP-binding protein [Cytophagales bacterium]